MLFRSKEHDRDDAVTSSAMANDEETPRLLLSLGASAKLLASRYEDTSLIAAAHLGHDSVVHQLIQAGAPFDHINNRHCGPLGLNPSCSATAGRAINAPCSHCSKQVPARASRTATAARPCNWLPSAATRPRQRRHLDWKSTRLNSSH